MGFRFRRSIRILPGLRLNIGKRGVSASVGVRGAHITVGHGKVRETIGLPGSGISYTHVEGTHQEAFSEAQAAEAAEPLPKGKAWRGWLWVVLAMALIAFGVYLAHADARVTGTIEVWKETGVISAETRR